MSPATAPSAPATLEQLARDVRRLQERLDRLEARFASESASVVAEPPPAPAVDEIASDAPSTSAIAGLAGKALLGLAGAYLLRALTEMKAIPLSVGVGVGIVYALGWLFLASRAPASERMTVGVRAVTSTLILIPLLWEAQIRFGAVPAALTAAVLVLFSTFGLAVPWRKDLAARRLGRYPDRGFHDLRDDDRDARPHPVYCRTSRARGGRRGLGVPRALAERTLDLAAAADLAVVLTVYLVTGAGGLPESYAPVGRTAVVVALLALLAIYLGSMTVRTLGRGFVVLPFEIFQCIVAFVIAGAGVSAVARGDGAVLMALGAFCAICAAGCYGVSFVFHVRALERERNLRTYAIFGFVLTVAACGLTMSGTALAAAWSALAVVFIVLGVTRRPLLAWHGAAYLAFASFLRVSAMPRSGVRPHCRSVGYPFPTSRAAPRDCGLRGLRFPSESTGGSLSPR